MNKILKNMSLSLMAISKDGRDMSLSFMDCNGKTCAVINCRDIYILQYHSTFGDDKDEGLPDYIGEVIYDLLCDTDLTKKLDELRFGFFVGDPVHPNVETAKRLIPRDGKAYWLHTEGSVIIDIVCGNINILPQ